MSNSITRRKFFGKAGGTPTAGGALAYAGTACEAKTAKKRPAPKAVDYYSSRASLP